MNVTIREAALQDAPKLADLLPGLFSRLQNQSRADLVQQLHDHLVAAQASSHSIFVAELEDAIIGYVAVHWLPSLFQIGPDGYVSELFVAASARGQALGSALLEGVLEFSSSSLTH